MYKKQERNGSSRSLATTTPDRHGETFILIIYYYFFSIPVAQMMRAGSPSHAMYPDDPHHPIQMSHQPVNER